MPFFPPRPRFAAGEGSGSDVSFSSSAEGGRPRFFGATSGVEALCDLASCCGFSAFCIALILAMRLFFDNPPLGFFLIPAIAWSSATLCPSLSLTSSTPLPSGAAFESPACLSAGSSSMASLLCSGDLDTDVLSFPVAGPASYCCVCFRFRWPPWASATTLFSGQSRCLVRECDVEPQLQVEPFSTSAGVAG